MKTFNFVDKVDYPFDTNIFAHIQDDYKLYEKVISMLLTGTVPGTGNYIVYGVEAVGFNITAGLVLINGELLRLEGGAGGFNEDTYIRIDNDAKNETVGGVVYTTYTEKICRVNDTQGTPIIEFIRLAKLFSEEAFSEINANQHKMVGFEPFNSIGITTHHASIIKSPYELTIRVQFSVDVAALGNSAAEVAIAGWQNAIGGSYGSENVNKVVGRYTLIHLDSEDSEVEQNQGNIIGKTGGIVKLMPAITLQKNINGLEIASYASLAYGESQTWLKYRVECEFRLTRNQIS